MDNKTDPQQDGLPPFHFRCQHGQVHSIEEGCNCESSTIEDKLEAILTDEDIETDWINEQVRKGEQPGEAYRLNRIRTVEAITAIITTETTNARINTLQELQPCDDHYDSKAVHLEDITAHIAALQEEQNEL